MHTSMIAEGETQSNRRLPNWPEGWPLPPGRAGLTPEEQAQHDRDYCEYLDRMAAMAAEAEASGDSDRW